MKTSFRSIFTVAIVCFYGLVQGQELMRDRDGKMYRTFTIHNKTWMAENLNVSHYRNGDAIPEARTGSDWERFGESRTGCWCYYEFKSENGTKYGKLYNWFAVNDPRGLAPAGWHVPKDPEWLVFVDYVGDAHISGKRMKTRDDWGFDEYCRGTNETGFSALPGGVRSGNTFYGIGTLGSWWCAQEAELNFARVRCLGADSNDLGVYSFMKQSGNSVRCVKD